MQVAWLGLLVSDVCLVTRAPSRSESPSSGKGSLLGRYVCVAQLSNIFPTRFLAYCLTAKLSRTICNIP